MDFKIMLTFLQQLAENNDRAWFKQAYPRYTQVKNLWTQVTQHLIDLLSTWHPSLVCLTPADCIFRLYTDTRFGHNKLPYKTNLGTFIAPGGRKSDYAGYYLHLESNGKSFLGGGLYRPQQTQLIAMRQNIRVRGKELQAILGNSTFKTYFGSLKGDKLKRVPRGYRENSPFVSLLKQKDFLVSRSLEDDFFSQEAPMEQIVQGFEVLRPLNTWINTALDTKVILSSPVF